ncbi:MAG: integration host factor subunit beta [Desulfovibrio sp.]|nr:integration host factor subunit beta [Desulfovibrio sp.]
MNRTELIKKLATDANIPSEEASQVLDVFVESLKRALLKGKRVELRGFGSFKIKEYEPYTGRNPRTGERVEVKGKRMPLFRAGKDLKKLVNS